MNETKQIDWSYPSSPNAVNMGFGRVGCWTVSIATGDEPAVAVEGFANLADAVDYAKTLPIPFGYLWRKYEVAVAV
jgi:hypothetical protein